MRRYLLAAVAAAAVASPAAARDGSGYIGVEGGLLFPRDNEFDVIVDYGDNEAPPDGVVEYNDGVELDYNSGIDLDLIAGYDFGMFRLEAELGWKRASVDELNVSGELSDDLLLYDDELVIDDFELDDRVSVLSFMANGLLDFGSDEGFGGYVGAGFGRARVKMFDDRDSAWALQVIAGVRTAVSDQLDIGLKYRFFRTGRVDFDDDGFAGDLGILGFDADTRFRSHSLLLSFIYNFAPPPPPPAPPAPPPPPPPAPATQTCPDGSVILATDACPAPPPPPPPPPPEPERG